MRRSIFDCSTQQNLKKMPPHNAGIQTFGLFAVLGSWCLRQPRSTPLCSHTIDHDHYGLRAQKGNFSLCINCATCNRLLCFLKRMLASLSFHVCQATEMLLLLPPLCPPSMLFRMLQQPMRVTSFPLGQVEHAALFLRPRKVLLHLNYRATATASSTSSRISATGCS